MRYLPHTEEEIAEMLAVTGQQSVDELFAHIPEDLRYQGEIDIPGPLSEWELTAHLESLGQSMFTGSSRAVLIGAGSYHHHIPEIVRSLSGRSEFLTSYTPYQPEMAQGTLQGIFEFQTLTARLLGTEVANASMYDGASALAEALLMAIRIAKKKRTVAMSSAIHPHYREVVRTYLAPGPFEIIELPFGADGRTDLSSLAEIEDLAGVALQSPNFFGVVEDHGAAAELVHDCGALYIACFSEPLNFGLYKNPGSFGADIVCGEGQSFGMNQSYGGGRAGHVWLRPEICQEYARQGGWPDRGQRRKARFCAHPLNARTTYSPRESDIKHLFQPGIVRHDRGHSHGDPGPHRTAGSGQAQL